MIRFIICCIAITLYSVLVGCIAKAFGPIFGIIGIVSSFLFGVALGKWMMLPFIRRIKR